MSHGIPIALGYLSVSFGFGIAAARCGISGFAAAMISATNLTSAGQAAGIDIIAAGGAQKLDKSFTLPHRLAASYGITDEIFAVCSAQKEPLTPPYMYGMIFIAFVGWVSGTIMGVSAGQLLPVSLSSAMGIVLYGMFLAIIIPPAKRQKNVLFAVVFAAVISVFMRFVLSMISSGFAVIISAVAASAIAALVFPVKDDEGAAEK